MCPSVSSVDSILGLQASVYVSTINTMSDYIYKHGIHPFLVLRVIL